MPVAKTKPAWIERHEAMNAKAKAGGIDLIYIGDSIVQFFETKGMDVWNRYYAPRKALNLGISADRTQHVLWRLDHGNIDGIAPKLAIVMIGQNNGGITRPRKSPKVSRPSSSASDPRFPKQNPSSGYLPAP